MGMRRQISQTEAGLAASLLLAFVVPVQADNGSSSDTSKAARIVAESVCVRCHGVEGRSTDPVVPSIAGQQRKYLEVQMKNFRAERRRDPDAQHYMWAIGATWLADDQMVEDVAAYFAAKTFPAGKPVDAATAATGKKFFESVNAGSGFPACSGCHGANAEGLSVFPRLAGQSPKYLLRQMQMLQVGLRETSAVHSHMLQGLSDADLGSVAAYLSSK